MTHETQATIGEWSIATFGPCDPSSPALARRVLEEVLELCFAVGVSYWSVQDTIRGTYGNNLLAAGPTKSVTDDMADVFVTLAGMAHRRGVDLQVAVDEKMRINRHERKWVAHGDGTGVHRERIDVEDAH